MFIQFLGVLRNKYLAMSTGQDMTFKSVILGGVHDIENIKLRIRDDKDRSFNSPWNIASDFTVDMSFSAREIGTMLSDYVKEMGIDIDIQLISEEIRRFTNGYPYLVSRLCKNIDEYLDRDWTLNGIERSIKWTLNEKNTLFDDIIKNIENNNDLKSVVNEILVEGKEIPYDSMAHEKGIMYGILAEKDGKLVVQPYIFETMIYNYLLAQHDIRKFEVIV